MADDNPTTEVDTRSDVASHDVPAEGSPRTFSDTMRSASRWFKATFPGRQHSVMGGICGLVVALLIFGIGFWRTLFIVICVAIGVAIGQFFDGNPRVVRAVRKVFSDNR